MPECLIIYYSGSGTTARVATHVSRGLLNQGWQVQLYNLEEGKPPAITDYQMLGIGSPVYFFKPVPEIRKYVNQTNLAGVPVFAFMAYGTDREKALNRLRDMVVARGGDWLGGIACRNANFVLGGLRTGRLTLDQVGEEDLIRAEEFGARMAALYKERKTP